MANKLPATLRVELFQYEAGAARPGTWRWSEAPEKVAATCPKCATSVLLERDSVQGSGNPVCGNCKAAMTLSDAGKLRVMNCPRCGEPNELETDRFITDPEVPTRMKVKGRFQCGREGCGFHKKAVLQAEAEA